VRSFARLEVDVPIEAALPPMRWTAVRRAAVDPEVPDHVEVAVYDMLAGATLNGRYGLFADSLATQSAIQADDPLQSYNVFVLQRFHDEFWPAAAITLYRVGRRALRQYRAHAALVAHDRAELLARADIQHRWYLAGDPRGTYGTDRRRAESNVYT
jgi:hypothetical protein